MKKSYEDIKEWFDDDGLGILRGLNDSNALRSYAEYILQICCIDYGSKVLEIGCGDALIMKQMKEIRPDINFFGIDISTTQINKAKLNIRESKFEVGNAVDGIKFMEKFDLIFSFSTVQYIQAKDLKRFNLNCVNNLNTGGKICHLSIPNINSKREYLLKGLKKKYPILVSYFLMLIKMQTDTSYGKDGGVWHKPENLRNTINPQLKLTFSTPSDSWYRFNYQITYKN